MSKVDSDLSDTRTMRYVRRVLARSLGPLTVALCVLNILAFIGFVTRDRNAALAMLFYLPSLPLGLAALLVDLLRQGRSMRGPRFALTSLGFVSVVCSALTMIGRGPVAAPIAALPSGVVRVLHWNVLWGGRPSTDAGWATIEGDIIGREPDVIILSEAPASPRLDSLETRLGPGWSSTRVEHEPGNPYWYKLVVLSRWPVRGGRMVPMRNGTAVDVRVERPGRPIRLLVVDGQSRVTRSRTPMLLDLARACVRSNDEGTPYDAMIGDFNAVGRSLGFDAVRAAAGGYELASWSCSGWRGTWPMPLPFYDIDHVWVHAGCRVLSCSLFTNPASDHRGQLVRLMVPASSPIGKTAASIRESP